MIPKYEKASGSERRLAHKNECNYRYKAITKNKILLDFTKLDNAGKIYVY